METHEIELSGGRIRYHEHGDGPAGRVRARTARGLRAVGRGGAPDRRRRVPLSRTDLLTALLRPRFLHRLPMTFGWLSRRPVDADRFLEPSRNDAAVRDDLRRFLVGVHRRHTLAAVEGLRRFERPVLLAWATEDRIFPISPAHRLAEVLPDASVVAIPDSYTFVPVDRPERLAELVVDFVRARTTS